MNKEKYQSFPIQFADNKFRHDSAIALSIKMLSSHKTDKAAELAEELCDECFDLNFTNVFCSSAQDLASSAASKELNVYKVEWDMHQGEKVG